MSDRDNQGLVSVFGEAYGFSKKMRLMGRDAYRVNTATSGHCASVNVNSTSVECTMTPTNGPVWPPLLGRPHTGCHSSRHLRDPFTFTTCGR
ncbi:hypothetical protein OK006_10327 [Actinobacteria bacterium OK006]|nr:hypothetical protein OK006_10327 [Actinobacteria bacterium OK006]